MIERSGDRLALKGVMTFPEALRWREQGLSAIDRDGLTLDLAGVEEADSTALSLLLEWQRAAKARGWTIVFANLPPNMRSLAEVYGVLELIALAGPAASS
ncbi:MAG: STAS domain-containing protein [Burkholderiales bacterium]|nr:STAS domain-containing protein [Burkholderiales bacterium]